MSKIKVRDFDKGVEINNTFYPKNYFRILVEDNGVVRISEIENDKSLYIHNWDEFEAIDVNGNPVTIASISDLEDDVLVPFFFRISSGGGTGTGDVVGTTTSGANEIVLYSDATGKKIKTSNVSIATTLGTDDTTVPTSKAVLDAIITQTYTSATIPALQAGQEVDYVIDAFNNTYRYKVLTDTSALETPYTHPAKFLRISPLPLSIDHKETYYSGDGAASNSRSAITYLVGGVVHLAVANASTDKGGVRIYNTATQEQVANIAVNGVQYITHSAIKGKLFFVTKTTLHVCSSVGADIAALNYIVTAETPVELNIPHIISDGATTTAILMGAKVNTTENVAYYIEVEADAVSKKVISGNAYNSAVELCASTHFAGDNMIHYGFVGSGLSRIIVVTWNSVADSVVVYVSNPSTSGLLGINVSNAGGLLKWSSTRIFSNNTHTVYNLELPLIPGPTELNEAAFGIINSDSRPFYISLYDKIAFIRRANTINNYSNSLYICDPTSPYEHKKIQVSESKIIGHDELRNMLILHEPTDKSIQLYKY